MAAWSRRVQRLRGLVRVAVLALTACGRLGFGAVDEAGAGAGEDGDPAAGGGRSLACAEAHVCAVSAGTLRCWGSNTNGKLGTGDTLQRLTATVIAPERTWSHVAAGVDHTCAVDRDGALFCWGDNDQGQLGVGDLQPRLAPTAVPLPAPVRQLDAHQDSTCATLQTGAVYCWGDNAEGQLAQADLVGSPDIPSPVPVVSAESWVFVAMGQAHVLAISTAGAMWGAGRNIANELGLGTGSPGQRRTLTQNAVGMWRLVSGGQNQSCGVDTAGQLSCWGANGMGQLGTGDIVDRDVPTAISPGRGWEDVSIHTFSACALANGNLSCWGRNVEGQLGTADFMDRLTPTEISSISDWVDVEVGRFFTCAMRADQSVWCTGENGGGQLGTGDGSRRNQFTQVVF